MLSEQILSVLTTHTHKKKELCEVMDVLISLILVKCKKKKNTLGKLKNLIEIFGQLTRGNPSASMTKIKKTEKKKKQERQENYRLTQEVQSLRKRSTE